MNKLNFDDIEVSKKEIFESKEAVNLSEVDVNKIVVSNKIKGNNETSKVFIGCSDDMSGCIKYFENGGKNMSFKIDDSVYLKYNEIGNKIKELLDGIKNKICMYFLCFC